MYLGIDLGTSELKICLIDEAQCVVGSTAAKLEISRPKPLWSEQAPQAWVLAMHEAMDSLRSDHPNALASVRAVAISGQMHGAVLLDAQHKPLRPAILWNDTRAHAECLELELTVPEARELTGNLVMPGFTAPKLAWLRRHDPTMFDSIRTVMLPKDFLTLHLCGELCTEMSDAAGTAWLDVARRDWSDAMLDATGLTRGHMPRLLEGSQPAGELRRELCERWGISSRSVVVAAGAGDNAAAGLGAGAIGGGRATVSLGSSGVIFVAADRHAANPSQAVHAFCHALPNRWIQMTVTLSATTSLSWAAALCGAQSDASFAARAESVDIDRAPLFLPYLNGERTPHNDAGAKGQFFGLTSSTDAASIAYSVMEGVAFSLADGHAALASAGISVDEAVALGGGSNSRYWLQLVAAATGIRLKKPKEADRGGAFGAARLAMLSSGVGSAESVCVAPETTAEIVAEPSLQQRLMPRLARYRSLYRRTRDLLDEA